MTPMNIDAVAAATAFVGDEQSTEDRNPQIPSPEVAADAAGPSGVKRQLFASDGSPLKRVRLQPPMPEGLPVVKVQKPSLKIVRLGFGLSNVVYEGKVLSRSGLFVKGVGKDSKRNLCCELLDPCCLVTVNLGARTTALAERFSWVLQVGNWVRVANFTVRGKKPGDCATSSYSLELTASSSVTIIIDDKLLSPLLPRLDTSATGKLSEFKHSERYAHGIFALGVFKFREEPATGAILLLACTSSNPDDTMEILIWQNQVTRLGEEIRKVWLESEIPTFYAENLVKGPQGRGADTGPETVFLPIRCSAQKETLVAAARLHARVLGSNEDRRAPWRYSELCSWPSIASV